MPHYMTLLRYTQQGYQARTSRFVNVSAAVARDLQTEGVHLTVRRADVHEAVGHRERRLDFVSRPVLLKERPGVGVQGIHLTVRRAGVQYAIGHHRRREHYEGRRILPQQCSLRRWWPMAYCT